MNEMNISCAAAGLTVTPHRRGLAGRVAGWIQEYREHAGQRRADELERLGWDLAAEHDPYTAARADHEPGSIVPPSVWLR